MQPKEILQELIAQKIVPQLAIHGFTYSPSQMKFNKKFERDGTLVKQTIHFSLNQRNTNESMSFWTIWSVELVKLQSNEKVRVGSSDWNIPGWYTTDGKNTYGQFDFSDEHKRSNVMKDLLSKIEFAGLPYLEKRSDWEIASEEHEKFMHRVRNQIVKKNS